ncbi:N-acetylmuramoyl-L-alanine amidase [Deinococcus knuensis]|uniref:N-acetylmuramoyl-L-alanine amidase n=1 Tax=Deinococcus knuensis TaxID=1837380 RepID=A0ABQ2SIC9_9DEIO|nr:N-acetylmuramoyl-L-alanine amidase [Deinococcus knuensis]GGS29792.1 N-acetylmuramoyl-L-alanine amidase [Deinococcus knuensis]
MKPTALFLSSALLLAVAGSGLAQTGDPFQRAAPTAVPPVVSTPVAQVGPGGVPAVPITLTGVQNATFGSPRSSNQGSATRVVFDLAPGVSYSLTPTFTGLRVDVQGARVQPAVIMGLGNSVTEYRAGGGQVTLSTLFPLSLTDGWQAREATLATGTRVLIIDIGATVTGGAPNSRVLASAPISAAAQAVLNAPVTPTPVSVSSLPPGDTVVSGGKVLPPAPALPGDNTARPSALSGQVPGTPTGVTLPPLRVGKSPGQTRVVLDLPPGTAYRIVPGPGGLSVELTGLSVPAQRERNVSPELTEWSAQPSPLGGTVLLATPTPTTARSGWRAQLLPPGSGTLSRLAIDLSPAMADLTPLPAADRVLAAVPPVSAARGTAILALSAAYVRPRVVIDAGHGGRDPGAVGSVIEKDVTLAVALRVRDLLAPAGVDVILTRDSDRELSRDKNTDLKMRAGLGTPGTQLFVSIHVNAMDARNALKGYGVETWWNPNHPNSSALAALLQRNMIEATGAFSKGLKNSQSLSVLRNSRVPAALVEIGFASHPVDGQNLKDSNYLDRVALGIAQGVHEALLGGVTADADSGAPALAKQRP